MSIMNKLGIRKGFSEQATHVSMSKEYLDRICETPDALLEIIKIIYGSKDDPEFMVLSKLLLTFQESDFIKLCSLFGGCTVTFPTIEDLRKYAAAVLLVHGDSFDTGSFTEKQLTEIRRIADDIKRNM